MEHLITETQNFSYIKFDGQKIYNSASTNQDAKIAMKELRLFKKIINAEKRNINNQLRTIRATSADTKASISFPTKGRFIKWARFGVRAIVASQTEPLEQWKTFYNNVLIQCDYIAIQLEKL